MQKRMSVLLLLLVFAAAFYLPSESSASSALVFKPNLKININGIDGTFNYGAPAIESGRSLLPLRDLLVNLGVSDDDEHIIWNAKTKTVNIIYNEITLSLSVDSIEILKNGAAYQKLEVPAKLVNNRVYLPARAVAEALGFVVDYDLRSESILVTKFKETETKPGVPINEPTKIEAETVSVVSIIPKSKTTIEVTFGKIMSKVSVESIVNYKINATYGLRANLAIVGSELKSDGITLIITTTEQTQELYNITFSDLIDSVGNSVASEVKTFVGNPIIQS